MKKDLNRQITFSQLIHVHIITEKQLLCASPPLLCMWCVVLMHVWYAPPAAESSHLLNFDPSLADLCE